jgi:hypothetical protein
VVSREIKWKICFKREIGFLNMSTSLQIKFVALTVVGEGQFFLI